MLGLDELSAAYIPRDAMAFTTALGASGQPGGQQVFDVPYRVLVQGVFDQRMLSHPALKGCTVLLASHAQKVAWVGPRQRARMYILPS